MTVSTSSAV